MMHAIIIDDELKGRSLLNELLSIHAPEIHVDALAGSADEGIRSIRKYQPDVVFLDINMPGKSGFEMLQEIDPVDFEIIFITAYDQYALKAFKYHAFDYLLKPLDADEFVASIERLKEKQLQVDLRQRLESLMNQLRQPQQIPERITIHSLDGITVVLISDIIYLEAAGTYSLFFLKNKDKIVSSINLKEYEELLREHYFFRVHNSFLINMAEVKKYIKTEGGGILMSNGNKVVVSKRRRDEFLKLLGTHKVSR